MKNKNAFIVLLILISVTLVLSCKKPVTYTIGESYGGGIVFYVDASGEHGLIAAPSDQSAGIQWYNGSFITTGATGVDIGTGNANTNTVVGFYGDGSYASKLCSDLVIGEFSDWYLPSKNELNELYLNRLAIGGFDYTKKYWSSSEESTNNASYQDFNPGTQSYIPKSYLLCVRAIRAF